MEASSMEKRRQDRYLKAKEQRKKRRVRNIIAASGIAIVCVSILLICLLPQKSAYRTLCDNGYVGTQEQLIASLVGEEMDSDGETAYALAVKNGYKKSKFEWMKTLTGAEPTDESQTTYQVACANGFEGNLTQW